MFAYSSHLDADKGCCIPFLERTCGKRKGAECHQAIECQENITPGALKLLGITENSHRIHRELTEGWGKVYDVEEDYTVLDGGRIGGIIDWMQRNRNSQS